LTAKLSERDERVTEARRRAEEDRNAVAAAGVELGARYGNPGEWMKQAGVVSIDELEENDLNLNIPRYIDTFDPEPRVLMKDALTTLSTAQLEADKSEKALRIILKEIGYAG